MLSKLCNHADHRHIAEKACIACSTLFVGSNTCTAKAATGCASPYYLQGAACTKTCPTGTYAKGEYSNSSFSLFLEAHAWFYPPVSGRTCVACSTAFPGSLTCTSTAAKTCSSGFVLISGKCQTVPVCASGRYLNTVKNTCDACSSKFSYSLTCTANEALTCKSPRVVINKVCAVKPVPTTTTTTTT